ncbi:MAG: LysM peptidoglycan-binding domain-containing protein [Sulfitobacter sp.]
MSRFSGGAGITVAGAFIVGVAVWYQFVRETAGPDVPLELAAVPQDAAPKRAEIAPEIASAQTSPVPATQENPQSVGVDEVVPAPLAEAPEKEPAQEPQQAEAATTIAPSFDEVRRETDGMTVIAGRAAPGATLTILLDGDMISSATADTNGKFAALAIISADGQGHVLSLMLDGVASDDQIILAPLDAPVAVAEADVAAEAAPTKVAEEEVAVEEAEQVTIPVMEGDAAPEEPAPAAEVADAGATPVEAAPETRANPVPEPTVDSSPETASAQIPEPAEIDAVQPQAPATDTETQTAINSTVPQGAQNQSPQEPQPAPQEVAVLRSTDEGVELLNVVPPEVMENVALDTISYSDQGEVQLSGRAQANTRTVRVYLDNDAVVSLSVDDQGRWRGDLPDVDEGIYTLRVDEVAGDGTVTSRVETPFKRESPAVLAAAAAGQDGPLKKITVQKGATLWAIAEARYGSGFLYVNVFKANQSDIRDPDLIYPGQVFDLPGD